MARQKWCRETRAGHIAHDAGLIVMGAGIAFAALGVGLTIHLESESTTICVGTATPPVCEMFGADPNELRMAEGVAAIGAAVAVLGAAALTSANTIDQRTVIWAANRHFEAQGELLLAGRGYELAEAKLDIVDRFEI